MATATKATKQGKTYLIIGGARSGKSAYAEQLCEESKFDLLYIATSPRFPNDAEMQSRIQHHVERRGSRWHLIEEELDLPGLLKRNMHPERAILVDCLTLWLNNLIFHKHDIAKARTDLISALKNAEGRILFITNEVGQGIVPADKLSRTFRDEQGRVNQHVASACDKVISVTAGIPLLLKPNPHPPISL